MAQIHRSPGRRGLGVLGGISTFIAVLLLAAPDAAAQRLTKTSTSLVVPPTSFAGLPLTLSATVSPVPDSGTITFTATGKNAVPLPGCTAVPVTAGTATCSFVPTNVGTYKFSASYSGSSLFAASTARSTVSVTPIVPVATTTTAGIVTAAPTAYQPVVLRAAVTPVPQGGTVTLTATLDGAALSLPSSCAALALDASGQGTCSFSPQLAGVLSVSAAYSGSLTHLASATTTPASGAVAGAATTVTVTDNATSVPGGPAPAVFGDMVVFKARVSPAGTTVPPTGSVVWTLTHEGPPDAAQGLGTCQESVVSDGEAICAVTPVEWSEPGDPFNFYPFKYSITATATFVPAAGTGWATGSTASDNTSKITLGRLLAKYSSVCVGATAS
ncbi:Ig-like domain-containing protein [Luteitalea sp.]|jgi:hypothetical protein|uniref:Ig-like domain-containing protein n=1 Tax=Luteitalea sp. TaxID=2004800 RepID=UPI0037C5108A